MDKRHHLTERRARPRSQEGSETHTEPRQKLIHEDRAAELLGVTTEELRRMSSETGLGHAQYEQGQKQVVFTYAELYRLCRSAVLVED